MESRWGGLLIDFFRPPVLVQLMARSLQIAAFHVVFLSGGSIYLKVFFFPLAVWVPIPGTLRYWKWELLGRWGQVGLYYLAFHLLQNSLAWSVDLPVLALSAYALLPFRLSSTLACVSLSHLARLEAQRLKAKNLLPMLAVGCFLVQLPHFLGMRDVILERLAAMLFLLAFTLYLEKLQKDLPLVDFLSHFLLVAYFLIPAIAAILSWIWQLSIVVNGRFNKVSRLKSITTSWRHYVSNYTIRVKMLEEPSFLEWSRYRHS